MTILVRHNDVKGALKGLKTRRPGFEVFAISLRGNESGWGQAITSWRNQSEPQGAVRIKANGGRG